MNIIRSAATVHPKEANPRTPDARADSRLPYLPLDGVAINPEIGFLILRTAPRKKEVARENGARSNLLWEISEDIFHGMPLLTDTVEVAPRMYGQRSKSDVTHRTSPTAPRSRHCAAAIQHRSRIDCRNAYFPVFS